MPARGMCHALILAARITTGVVGLTPNWVILDPKLDKSGAFSDQISVHLARGAIWGQSDPLWSQIYNPWAESTTA